jgi:SRSO17 transposase
MGSGKISWMNFHGLRQVQHRLNNFLGELVTMMGRSERAHWATMYIRGLLLDGDRKSIQPMAQRIGGDLESMQQFVSDSPWDVALVQEQLCVKLKRDFPAPETWIIDEVSFPKAGKESVGVAWQYCGALGKKANCQVAVSLHAATQEFSVPVDWRLYLPKEWTNDRGRCDKAKVPKEVVHQTKNQLALELVKDARDWGLPLAPVVADSAYGNDYAFREGLREEGLSYVVAVEPNSKAWTSDPAQEPLNKLSAQEALLQSQTLEQIARALPTSAWEKVSWRPGTKGPLVSRFSRVGVWASHGMATTHRHTIRPQEWLLIEWPEGEDAPTGYWLGWFPPKEDNPTPSPPTLEDLVRIAKSRWRVEQDYREMKGELGLDHFEGRNWRGFHHHVTLVSIAFAFLRSEQMRSKRPRRKRRLSPVSALD